MITGNLENNFKKVTYEILYQDVQTGDNYVTTYSYDTIEECKKDFGLYTSSIEKVTGIKKIEHIETEIKVKDLI